MPGYQKLFFKGNPSKVNLQKTLNYYTCIIHSCNSFHLIVQIVRMQFLKKFLVFKFIVKEIELLPQTRVAGVVTVVRL